MDLSYFIFLSSGLFLGWSLGANDAANIFGTAVGTKMVKFRTAAIISSIFIILGAIITGSGASQTLSSLGTINALPGAFMVALAAAITIYWMVQLGLPVSTSQAIVGAIIGWNIYSDRPTELGVLSQIVGKSRSHIANTLRLLGLPLSVQNMIKEGKLSAGQARNLVGLENAEELALLIIKKDLNVRQVEELVNKLKSGKLADKKEKVAKNEDIADIEKDLNKKLGLRIKINPNKQGGGKVVLQYGSVAELDMIIEMLEQKRKNTLSNSVESKSVKPEEKMQSEEKFTMKIID